MFTRFLNPIVLVCSAFISISSMQVHAQSQSKSLNLVNNASLSSGMSATAVRTYDQLGKVLATTGKIPNAANIGTTGANKAIAGSSGTSTINGKTQMTNASTNEYTLNNGQLVATGSANNDFSGSMQPGGYTTGTGATMSAADWLTKFQVAAPIVASATGNYQLGQVAGIAGAGAQIYNAISNGSEQMVTVHQTPTELVAAKPILTPPAPFSFQSKTDAYGTNVYYKDVKITGLAPNTPFKLDADFVGKAGIASPLSAGLDDIASGNWYNDKEVMTNQYGEIPVRIRNMADNTVGGSATIRFMIKGSSNEVLASQNWSVITAKPSIVGGGYWGDPSGPSGFAGTTRDPWNPQ